MQVTSRYKKMARENIKGYKKTILFLLSFVILRKYVRYGEILAAVSRDIVRCDTFHCNDALVWVKILHAFKPKLIFFFSLMPPLLLLQSMARLYLEQKICI
ncbi:uncharacterized protein BYT42DRAFT_578132 [Radiomyces spectabilis]|uniref:uncharacterized protein n=1 Tax=Radiomyces spectabilis TaxID=64574 RepID=UPI0022208AAE|nr:uncharacterized protein BYT42DRAFT_578132 [Radiomyces spectabilis]KAI8372817.1 hypothetical protein BYT42DRAFT_578132 [Radiomyces spectabilis]